MEYNTRFRVFEVDNGAYELIKATDSQTEAETYIKYAHFMKPTLKHELWEYDSHDGKYEVIKILAAECKCPTDGTVCSIGKASNFRTQTGYCYYVKKQCPTFQK